MRRYFFTIAAYILITALTVPFFMGDTVGYADSIAHRNFSDFGHFLWYPLGWIVSTVLFPITQLFVGSNLAANVALSLVIINWFAGLASALMVFAIADHISRRPRIANTVTLAFILSQGFLSLTQSGCSYVPGLAFLLAGICLMVKNGDRPERLLATSILAGSALAISIGLWFTYVCSIPAALAAPLFIYGFTKERVRLVLQTAAALAVAAMLIYGSGAAANGIHSVQGLKQWVRSSSHGISAMNGAPRMAFGLARSFINMGNDGALFKAYLAHDPYNPVTLMDLVRTSLVKLALFYVFIGAILINLLRSLEGKRILALLALNALPVFAFALMWEGGAIERYLLVYPLVFLALAFSLSSPRSVSVFKYASLAFVAIMAVSNLIVMAKPVQDQREQAVVTRIKDLKPRLKSESVVATINQQDEVWAFRWTFPFNPINTSESLNTYHIVEPLTDQVLRWRESFATEILSAWDKGGDAWVSTRVFSPRPERDWNWVEGADPNVSWKDINAFFSEMQMGETVGSDDGFLLLLPTEQNRSLLARVAQQKKNESGSMASINR